MDKQFWQKLSALWVHTQSEEEKKNIDMALRQAITILKSDTETKYGKNPLLEE